MPKKEVYLDDDPLWYKDAIIYELHVKTFYDSNGDGIGDFRGLIEKLDYLEHLGVTALWILPFYPSPLRDDGYDTGDYLNIHQDYGSLRDFREFLRQAHRHGMRVITELVLNHTSDQHQWFQRARQAKPGSTWRNFYVWSDTQERYKDARIIFKDFEPSNWAWDPVAKAYYWHRFYSHQPDLNFDNPQVQKALFRVIDFWFGMGVDGLRLDAIPYLYEREGTNCENLPETYAFLKKLRAYIDGKFKNRMLLAEANQWPEDATAYFGDGDECHMAFHFPLMPRMFMSLWMEDHYPIIDILEQTPSIPESAQWALFLRNHDELTLEMVTDEERDYMYRVYARDPRARINLGIRRRLAPLVGNNRRKIELMNILLFSLPGTPIIYYGDEIGMGDNYYLGDRNGVRTPMQWSPDRNAGFSRVNPQKLYLPVIIDPEYHYESVNVENHERNLSSLLWWMKRVIGMRKRFKAFGRGTIEFLSPNNPKVLAFIRRYEDENILVVINLSRFSQVVGLDLSQYAGFVPEEVFSQNKFPIIKKSPYVLTFGPYDHYWLLLKERREPISVREKIAIPGLRVEGNWERVLEDDAREILEKKILPGYLKGCRWFAGKARTIRQIKILESIPIPKNADVTQLVLLEVGYTEGTMEVYSLAVSYIQGAKAKQITQEFPQAVIACLHIGDEEGILCDGIYDEKVRESLLAMIAQRKRIKGKRGELVAFPGREFRSVLSDKARLLTSQVLKAEQSNTSVLYEDKFFLKLCRRLEEGVNPDLEILRFLTGKTDFSQVPPFAGAIEYRCQGSEPILIGLLQGFVPNQGDAWTYSLDAVCEYFERILSRRREIRHVPEIPSSLLGIEFSAIPPLVQELIGGVYFETARLLGKRTAELHLALSSVSGDADFAPEPFSTLYQRSVYQSMRSLARRVLQSLGKNLKRLREGVQKDASAILASEQEILARFQKILPEKISAMKIRIHGDYHLGQVLFTGKDFVIIDFEGEPARTLSERRLKRSPLRDVAGMIRSFHYAAYNALFLDASLRAKDKPLLEPWADLWYHYVSGIFLHSYLETCGEAPFIPHEKGEIETLLQAFLLDKAIYELGYELNNRPDWIIVPVRGVQCILKSGV
ncbi:MAG: maltose alpha-D-glucosyltransferase [Deltaproteobacteria bacterium]|nr:maltose alpha-D-glucosyltransferase [Deltaproteobacteria bacterium]